MQHEKHFYIDGQWVDPLTPAFLDVIDPSTEEAYTRIAVGSAVPRRDQAAYADRLARDQGRAFQRFERIGLQHLDHALDMGRTAAGLDVAREGGDRLPGGLIQPSGAAARSTA